MSDELSTVQRIGPPLPRMTFPCPACGGSRFRDDDHFCRQCAGTGLVWADVPIPIGEPIK